ncbi:MAG: hypothetical protein TRG1_2085 [Flavobacteriaceae bacterium FS1-H7996/R]|nr:MAG: hypothetical protein TRG1_2085 [Flavobacteriaceae bacterium FS1-H7996/R]
MVKTNKVSKNPLAFLQIDDFSRTFLCEPFFGSDVVELKYFDL